MMSRFSWPLDFRAPMDSASRLFLRCWGLAMMVVFLGFLIAFPITLSEYSQFNQAYLITYATIVGIAGIVALYVSYGVERLRGHK